MLEIVELAGAAEPAACARALADVWLRGLVFHLRGIRPALDLREFYGEMFNLVGEPARLAENARLGDRDHQRTDEVWMEVRYDPSLPDAYRHSDSAQPLHTDGSYIPAFPNAGFLACVSQASVGGETVFVDGAVLVGILARKAPDLLRRLRLIEVPHARSGDRRVVPIIRDDAVGPLLNWNYYCVDEDANAQVIALRTDFFHFLATDDDLATSLVPVRLAPGEAVVWKDDRVLHGRTGFKTQRVSGRFFWKATLDVQPEKMAAQAQSSRD